MNGISQPLRISRAKRAIVNLIRIETVSGKGWKQDVLSNYCAISLVDQLVNRLKVRKIMQYEDYVSLIQSFLLLSRHLILVHLEQNSMPLIWYNCNYFQILYLFNSICRFFGPNSWKLQGKHGNSSFSWWETNERMCLEYFQVKNMPLWVLPN